MRLWWRLVRLGFHLLYNHLAFTYDIVSKVVSLGAWRCWQRSALAHLPAPGAGRVLELAHGTGDLQIDLRERGYDTVGCDLSPYMGRIARRKLAQQQLSPNLVRGRAEELPFASKTYIAVVSTFPSQFIIDPDTLHEVHRVLQPGGCFVIVPGSVLTAGGGVRALLEWLYRITGQREGYGFDVPAYFARYGFDATLLQETCPHSCVYVIVARKIG